MLAYRPWRMPLQFEPSMPLWLQGEWVRHDVDWGACIQNDAPRDIPRTVDTLVLVGDHGGGGIHLFSVSSHRGVPLVKHHSDSKIMSDVRVPQKIITHEDQEEQRFLIAVDEAQHCIHVHTVAPVEGPPFIGTAPHRKIGSSAVLRRPFGCAVDKRSALWVVDCTNSRVVMFEDAWTEGSDTMTEVLGPNGTAKAKLRLPVDMCLMDTRPIGGSAERGSSSDRALCMVTDRMNGRLAVVDDWSTGSVRFVEGLELPMGLSSDGRWVADFNGHRIVQIEHNKDADDSTVISLGKSLSLCDRRIRDVPPTYCVAPGGRRDLCGLSPSPMGVDSCGIDGSVPRGTVVACDFVNRALFLWFPE